MPRASRKQSETKIYHVMIRGNERKNIFFDDDDRNQFLDTLRRKNRERLFSVYAFCLMSNHVHLLLNARNEEIGRIMQRINTSYAHYFNKKYVRVGHLFQDRFKSEAIESDQYLLAVARYIHQNPVKAKIVQAPGRYKWSSYNTYVKGTENANNIVETEMLLRIFSEDMKDAKKHFIEFTNQESEDEFIEDKEDCTMEIEIDGELEVTDYVEEYLRKYGLTLIALKEKQNIAIRNEMIRTLKDKSNLSIRELSVILGLNRNTIQRVK